MKEIHLIRSTFDKKQTLGNLFVVEGTKILFQCKTLELPWLNNARGKSCIPPGSYPIELEYSPAFKRKLWELKNVPQRSEIKIHQANFFNQLRGCIALGDKHVFINGDEFKDLRNSRKTVNRFHEALGMSSKTWIHVHSAE